jgi:hypothetical protein
LEVELQTVQELRNESSGDVNGGVGVVSSNAPPTTAGNGTPPGALSMGMSDLMGGLFNRRPRSSTNEVSLPAESEGGGTSSVKRDRRNSALI